MITTKYVVSICFREQLCLPPMADSLSAGEAAKILHMFIMPCQADLRRGRKKSAFSRPCGVQIIDNERVGMAGSARR